MIGGETISIKKSLSLWNALRRYVSIALFLGISSASIAQRFPADVTPILGPPHTLFLTDYTEPGSNALMGSVLFNDFNEPEWTFRLRLTIESAQVKLETSPNYIPPVPITVVPGVPEMLSGDDWIEYLDYNNMIIQGITRSELTQTGGKLPEGFYTFCIQVLDYATGDVLSRESCTSGWIQLNEPPRIITPHCGGFVDPSTFTQINFQWQSFNTMSPNALLGSEYQLTIWEVTEPGADPLSAVANGQALQVFQSDPLMQPSYIYGLADPALEGGKQYVYQIQAISTDGLDRFSNNGFSEFCYFNYGFVPGGNIRLTYPEDNSGFRSRSWLFFEWDPPSNAIPNQFVEYEMRIFELDGEQPAEEGVASNPTWFEYHSNPAYSQQPFGYVIEDDDKRLTKMARYAWQVKAHAGEQQVASSEIQTFRGPPAIEMFYAGIHEIIVLTSETGDLSNFSGTAEARIDTSGTWIPIEFNNLRIEEANGIYVLTGGEIYKDLEEPQVNLLVSGDETSPNGDALFEINRFRFDREGLSVYGNFAWDLPFPTLGSEKAVVRSDNDWMVFDKFQVSGNLYLSPDNSFQLLDPYQFTLDLATSSVIYLNLNRYWLEWDGQILLPDAISGVDKSLPASYPFSDRDQVFYMPVDLEQDGISIANNVSLATNTKIHLLGDEYTIDLSETESPGVYSGDNYWKGIYHHQFEVRYLPSLDASSQLALSQDEPLIQEFTADGNTRAWIDGQGLDFKIVTGFDQVGATFNTFPSNFNLLYLEITDNSILPDSRLDGNFLLPIVSQTQPFSFTIPLNDYGFGQGIVPDLVNTRFTFNTDDENELLVDIKRAVFEENERLEMTLNISWPALGIEVNGVDHFKAWGDYNIGFYTPDGLAALTRQLSGEFHTYPVMIDALAAGRSRGRYGFSALGKVVMAENVSGTDGPPAVNIYTLQSNGLLNGSYNTEPGAFGDPFTASGRVSSTTPEEIRQQAEQQAGDVKKDIDATEGAVTAQVKSSLETFRRTDGGCVDFYYEYQDPTLVTGEILGDVDDLKEKLEVIFLGMQFLTENEEQKENFQEMAADVRRLNSYELATIYAGVRDFEDGIANAVIERFREKVPFIEQVDQTTEELVFNYQQLIDDELHKVERWMTDNISRVVYDAAEGFAGVDGIDNQIVMAAANEMVVGLVDASLADLRFSARDNLVDPVTSFIDYSIRNRMNAAIDSIVRSNVKDIISGDFQPESTTRVLQKELEGAVKDLATLLSPSTFAGCLGSFASDILFNIHPSTIVDRLRGSAINAMGVVTAKLVEAGIEELANEVFAAELDLEIPVDFARATAQRLFKGENLGDVITDAVPVIVRSPVLDVTGLIYFTPDDPRLGDVWQGAIDVIVKKPKNFIIPAVYVSGRKDDTNYWFAELGVTPQVDPEAIQGVKSFTANVAGDISEQDPGKIDSPINFGAFSLVGLVGRAYHNMSGTSLVDIQPNPEQKFGAYMRTVFFGGGGKLGRVEVEGEINTYTNGDFTLDLAGDVQILSPNASITKPDQNAAIVGVIEIRYNSAEQHFLGFAQVELNQVGAKVICANGSLLVDVKPGSWRVAFGQRELAKQLRFLPGCQGWGARGWFDVNPSEAYIGLGVEYAVRKEFGAGVKVGIDAGVAAGVQAIIGYSPISLNAAGFWAEMWAMIYLRWKVGFIQKRFTIVDLYLSGDMLLYFHPEKKIEGNVKGRIKVLIFNFGFNKDFETKL